MVYLFLYILSAHWLADFVLQTHWQASNKSKNNVALTLHVSVYTAVMTVAVSPGYFIGLPPVTLLLWVLINGGLHWCTDWVTSRCSSYFYVKQDWHNFFVVVGFDQFIHQVTLGVTLVYLVTS